MADVVWQPSLLAVAERPEFTGTFDGAVRHELGDGAWYDHGPGWLTLPVADELFETLLSTMPWKAHTRRMYDKVVDEPRLRASWKRSSGEPVLPIIGRMLEALTVRYERPFATGGLNLYRDGRDSVAWHRDRIPAEVVDPVVGLVSLGHARPFRLRPYGGGRSRLLDLRHGDLLVTGGTLQRTWEHAVPKVASAGPRVSITFRHG